MSATQSSGGVPIVAEKQQSEMLESIHVQQAQPIDLASSSRPSSVVQIRPVVRAFGGGLAQNTHITSMSSSSSTSSGKGPTVGSISGSPSIISVNRTGPNNLTILPSRSTSQGIPTYQIARSAIVSNIRPGAPGSITVTPISTSNFNTNTIRLTGATVNNSWIQTTGSPQSGNFTPIRATTIIGRAMRPDGKIISIPQQGSGIQHVTQLQMVDNKGSIIKPQITPLVNVRGINPQGSTNLALPLSPFTIRAANINLPIQQRPTTTTLNSNTANANIVQKVIPGQGGPIQLLNTGSTQKLSTGQTIQTLTSIPRLNTVCLTLTSNATLTPNSNPVMTRGSNSTNLIMTPSTTGNLSSLTKVYPVTRDGVEALLSHPQSSGASKTQINTSASTPNTHQVVQAISVGLPGGSTTSYYLDQKGVVTSSQRPLQDNNKGGLKSTGMIISQGQPPQGLSIPIVTTHGNYTHAIPIAHQNQHLIGTNSSHLQGIPGQIQLSNSGNPISSIVTLTNPGGGTHLITTSTSSSSNATSINPTPSTTAPTSAPASNIPTSSTTTSSSSNTLAVTSASSTSSSGSNATQSPSTSKSTLSPRPSILRKREAGGDGLHNATVRAQRNLALNFALGSNAGGVPSSSSVTLASSSTPGNPSKESLASTSSIPGVNDKTSAPNTPQTTPTSALPPSTPIAIKEFQPPNEESSWQSCSSNSSSGSSTISTTSETAELQLQQQAQLVQQQQQLSNPHSSSKDYGFSMGSSLSHHSTNSQNGILPERSVPVLRRGGSGQGSSKAFSRDLERVKAMKGKEESVSPRKKPRKQQLTTSDLLETPSPEISFYQGKRLKRNDLMRSSLFEDFDEKSSIVSSEQSLEIEPQQKKNTVYYIKRPQMSLLTYNKGTWKPRLNHFERYSEVKSKDEKRPTVSDMANQKGVHQKINGWKVQHLSKQMDEIIDLESNVVANFNSFLSRLEEKHGSNSSDRDLNRIQELLKGNIQRCKVIRDQMTESRSQVSRILDHRSRIMEVIQKYASKRPSKKRERL